MAWIDRKITFNDLERQGQDARTAMLAAYPDLDPAFFDSPRSLMDLVPERGPEARTSELQPSDRIAYGLADWLESMGAPPSKSMSIGKGTRDVLMLTPFGTPMAVGDTTFALSRGDYLGASLAALGAIPGGAWLARLRRIAGHTPPQVGQFARYAEEYPPAGPPALYEKGTRKKISFSSQAEADELVRDGIAYWGKSLSPEARELAQARRAIQRDMDANGYPQYFDPAKRADVDPRHYPMDAGPVVGMPAKVETAERLRKRYLANGSRERVIEAFDRGPIAAMTAGNSPTANFLMAHYAERERKAGRSLPKNTYEWPYPIGGRYAASNAGAYEKFLENNRKFDVSNPKRREFLASMLGFRDRNVIDSRVSGALEPGRQTPRNYGVASEIMDDVAKEVGARDRRHFGDAVWAGLGDRPPGIGHNSSRSLDPDAARPPGMGHNSNKAFDSDRLAIAVINGIIERTHRLTGMSRDEIFLRGFLLREIPLYGTGGAMIAPIAAGGLSGTAHDAD
jgi:hypothetical protein